MSFTEWLPVPAAAAGKAEKSKKRKRKMEPGAVQPAAEGKAVAADLPAAAAAAGDDTLAGQVREGLSDLLVIAYQEC